MTLEKVDPEKVRRAMFKNSKSSKAKDQTWRYGLFLAGATGLIISGLIYFFMAPPTTGSEAFVNDPTLTIMLNRQATFEAGPSSFFEGWKLADVKRQWGGIFWSNNAGTVQECAAPEEATNRLPKIFDARDKWPACFETRAYEGVTECSASGAIAIATTLSNRYCISTATGGIPKLVDFSPQVFLSCPKPGDACKTTMLDQALHTSETSGVVSSECFPYKADDTTPCQFCTNEPVRRTYSVCSLREASEDHIKRELFTNGPVVGAMILYSDMLQYKSGVYNPTKTAVMLKSSPREPLTHGCKIIGWGTEKGADYWLLEVAGMRSDWGREGHLKLNTNAFDTVVMKQSLFAPEISKFKKRRAPTQPEEGAKEGAEGGGGGGGGGGQAAAAGDEGAQEAEVRAAAPVDDIPQEDDVKVPEEVIEA
eukprot:GHVU01008835.1.p1 GENE.GHVU01008835.1~~GHVU01008835.1.p1  ORF type:complete len:423 (-),score=105.90 GHVU01008835.1:247-1515(-)